MGAPTKLADSFRIRLAHIIHDGSSRNREVANARRASGAAREGGILETVCRPTERRARPLGRVKAMARLVVAANARLQQKWS